MVGSFPPHSYRSRAASADLTAEQVDRALREQRFLANRGLPVVWSLGHLAWLSEAPYLGLRHVVDRTVDPYTDQWIQRRFRRTRRHISAPGPLLRRTQSWLLMEVLRRTRVHQASMAFEPGDSTLRCAERHIGARWLMKFDLRDFFHSIDETQVHQYFTSLGYPALIAFEMSRLCTRILDISPLARAHSRYSIPSYQPARLGVLPQGAPTSGALANRIARKLDEDIEDIARRGDLVYSRYADDIILSGGPEFSRRDVGPLIASIRHAAKRRGFQLNETKHRVAPPGAAKYVLGLLVLDDRVALPRAFKREVERAIRGVGSHGVPRYAERRGFVSMIGFVNHVSGKIAYAGSIEPAWASAKAEEWTGTLQEVGVVV